MKVKVLTSQTDRTGRREISFLLLMGAHFLRWLGVPVLLLLGAVGGLLNAQIMTVANDTATPIAGAGHDYRRFLSETVSPANGSVSVRIQVPVPKDRGITIPFSFNYDSAGVNHLSMPAGVGLWITGSGYLNSGGWSYGLPLLTSVTLNWPGQQSNNQGTVNCLGQNDFVFTNSAGERHALMNLTWFSPSDAPSCPPSNTLSGDPRYTAQISDTSSGTVLVADTDGTVFTFNQSAVHPSTNPDSSANTFLPATIEDRNGNVINVADPGAGGFTFTDSAGRPAISSSGFGAAGNAYNLTVSGLTNAYQVAWGSAGSSYSVGYTPITGNACGGGFNPESGTQSVVTSITLPNGQQYQFQYDSTYGLLNKVTYPNGAYSRYVWSLNRRSDSVIWPDTNGAHYWCTYTYDTPAVQSRYVSFDGVNEVLEEDYSYGTTWLSGGGAWSSKTATVTTKVSGVQNGSLRAIDSFSTNYTYSPSSVSPNQYDAPIMGDVAGQLPLEQTIVSSDFNARTLKTVAKTWYNPFQLASVTLTLDDGSTTSQTAYAYNYYGQLETESDYGYGAGSPGALIRQTSFNYQPFPNTPIFPGFSSILDRPCQIITYDNSGTNRIAETDYLYDGGTTVCGTAGTPSVTQLSGVIGHDETNYAHQATVPRANVTQELQAILQSSKSAATSYTYDETGQVTSKQDPNGNTTSYSYADNYAPGAATPSGQTNAYLTKTTLPIIGSQTFQYRYSDGQLASSTDQNSQITSYSYNDTLGRLTGMTYPDGGSAKNTYNDTGATPSIVTTRALTGSSSMTSTTVMDGASHTIQTQLNSDPSGTDFSDTVYDGLGRTWIKSNPYRSTSDSTYGITSYLYDALGRATSVTTPDGEAATTGYAANQTTVTDQAGHGQTTTTDALGRITNVIEDPGSSPHLNYSTTYTYDALGDLIGVNQSGKTRMFGYDSLGRLTSAANPESGHVSYTYDGTGNLLTKVDARNRMTCFGSISGGACSNSGYDALNRPTMKSYSDGTPTVQYSYDKATNGIGRLYQEQNTSSSSTFNSYDPMGRIKASTQTTGGASYAFAYTYNLAGSMLSETYPSGRTISFQYDGANRVQSLSGTKNGAATNYASQMEYAPHGGFAQISLGNGLGQVFSYNQRLQPSEFTYTQSGQSNYLLDLKTYWGVNATQNKSNNGNLQSVLENTNSGVNLQTMINTYTSYNYDGANRLIAASDNNWSRSFGYDAYGNMWVTSWTTITPSSVTPTSNGYNANNQLMVNAGYDTSGNQTTFGVNTMTYDAESRQISVTNTNPGMQATYLYDGDGKRVTKAIVGGSTTLYVYDAMGRLAAEYSSGDASAPPCATCYLSWDHLGSTRLVTDQGGNVVARHDFLPFGEEIQSGVGGRTSVWGASDLVTQKFTGKERDAESGLDYFKYRMYASSMGRWMSPDPSGLTHVDLGNPQELNLYNYVGNNPLTRTDLDGLCIKGFQWACNIVQSIDNGFHGLGFQTNASVDREQHTANQTLHHDGVQTEGLSRRQVRKAYRLDMALGSVRSEGDDGFTYATRIRPTAAQARAIWEKATGGKVPYDESLGRFYDMAHKTPIADGGSPRDPANLEPMLHSDHMDSHKEDFVRWGSRSGSGTPGEPADVTIEPTVPVVEPPIIIDPIP